MRTTSPRSKPVVTLPFPVDELRSYPADFQYTQYSGREPTDELASTEFWVTPYLEKIDYAMVVPAMGRLKVVQAQSAGTDDIAAWMPLQTTLCNARGVHDAATAEMAVTLILASLRQLPTFTLAQLSGKWTPNSQAESLADKTVLIVGFGSIGRALGRRLEGFECDVIGVTRLGRNGELSIEELPNLIPTADVVVILTPLTPETRHLVDAVFLREMKTGSLLVNMSRGAVVDTSALVAELATGRIFAALDVTDPEPLPPDHRLWGLPGVVITPHVGGGTSAMRPRMLRLVESQLVRFAAGEPLLNVVKIR